MPHVQIRNATKDDVPLILRFIRELAEYEKLSHDVIASEGILHKTLFGKNPKAEVILAYLDQVPVGFALFFHNYSTFLGRPGLYLEDLYVIPEHRGHGIGKKLFRYLAQTALQRNCGRLEWWVLNWNKSAINFYEGIGAKAMDDWTVYRVTGEKLKALSKAESHEETGV